MLLNNDWSSSNATARILDSYNRERQDIEREITEQAQAQVEAMFSQEMGYVLHEPEWHAGVVGIVASRIARKFNSPAIIFGADSDGQLKGSGRSIDGVDLVEVLKQCSDHIIQWGGHPMAVGLTIEASQLEPLRRSFNDALGRLNPNGLPEQTIQVDVDLQSTDLTEKLLGELESLTPFGQGNPEPLFCIKDSILQNIQPLGSDHFRFQLIRPGSTYPLEGVAWGLASRMPIPGIEIDIVVKYHWHTFRGRRSPRLTLLDWRN